MQCLFPLSERMFPIKPDHALKVCIVVPVRNEQDCLHETVQALHHQVSPEGTILDPETYEVLVMVNNSDDNSFIICQEYKQKHSEFKLHACDVTLPPEAAHVGTVRKLLMDEAYLRLMSIGNSSGIIVSTDGDSVVDKEWLYHIMAEMEKGVDVVSGRIIPRDVPVASKWPHLRDVNYRFLVSRLESLLDPCQSDPWPRHFQCYGPSIAVTCEIYSKVGGIKALPYLEDEDFRKSLKRIDAKMRKSPNVKIYTSSRLVGRVDFGFSVQLDQWQKMHVAGEEQQVENLHSVLYRFENKRRLRQLWLQCRNGDLPVEDLRLQAKSLHLSYEWLKEQVLSMAYFEELWEQVELKMTTRDNPNFLLIPISFAISEFRSFFANHTAITTTTSANSFENLVGDIAV